MTLSAISGNLFLRFCLKLSTSLMFRVGWSSVRSNGRIGRAGGGRRCHGGGEDDRCGVVAGRRALLDVDVGALVEGLFGRHVRDVARLDRTRVAARIPGRELKSKDHLLLVGLLVPVLVNLEANEGEGIVALRVGVGGPRQLHVARKARCVVVGVLLDCLQVPEKLSRRCSLTNTTAISK